MKISNIINTLFIGVFLISGTIFLEGKNRQEKEIFFYSFSFFFLHPFHSIQIARQEISDTSIRKGDIRLSYANVKEFVSSNVIPLMRWSFIFYIIFSCAGKG